MGMHRDRRCLQQGYIGEKPMAQMTIMRKRRRLLPVILAKRVFEGYRRTLILNLIATSQGGTPYRLDVTTGGLSAER
jgi:hypothetical protein